MNLHWSPGKICFIAYHSKSGSIWLRSFTGEDWNGGKVNHYGYKKPTWCLVRWTENLKIYISNIQKIQIAKCNICNICKIDPIILSKLPLNNDPRYTNEK